MAPTPVFSYFPPLERCLNGDQRLISWKAVYSAFTSNIELGNDHRAVIESFLKDEEVLRLLEDPFSVYAQPSAQTKAAFETKTSAINITPSPTAKYDIKQIKEDSLWLSKAAKIDEVSALRLVIEECQSRTSAQLLGQFSEEELVSIRDAAGNNQSSIPLSLLEQGLDPDAILQQFVKPDTRKQRIFRTYFSERRYLLKCTERLIDAFFSKNDLTGELGIIFGKGKGVEPTPSWQVVSGGYLVKRFDLENVGPIILRCIGALNKNLQSLDAGCGWTDEDGERGNIEVEWARNQFAEATYTLELMSQFALYLMGTPSSQIALEWFRLQQAYGFFSNFESDDSTLQVTFSSLRSMTTVISLKMLAVIDCLDWLNNSKADIHLTSDANEPYIMNTRTITEIHDILMQAADIGCETMGPTLLGWSLILRAISIRAEKDANKAGRQIEAESYNPRSSIDSAAAVTPDSFEAMVFEIMAGFEEDPIDFLARRAVNTCEIFQTITSISLQLGNTSAAFVSKSLGVRMRIAFLGIIKTSVIGVGYIPELVEAVLAILTGGENYWDILDADPFEVISDPVTMFLLDDELVNALLIPARSRYPCETLPFLQMIRALASCSSCYGRERFKSAQTYLESIPMFTYTLPADFFAYETVEEEENANNIRLTQPMMLFEPRLKAFRSYGVQNRMLTVARIDEDFYIPTHTQGRIVSESEPKVAFWYHKYNGLKYFGKLLETFLASSEEVDATTHQPIDRDSVCEIIGIIATFLLSIAKSASYGNPDPMEEAIQLLSIASSGLNRNRDIISVIFDILEEELQNQSACSGAHVPLDILVSCIHFIHAMIPIAPGKVWPLMSRSGLLGVSRGDGKLPSIIESVELVSGRYDFLMSCCHLYQSLVEDFTTNAIRRRSRAKSAADWDESVATGIPDQVLAQIILCFTRYLVDVLESSPSWKYADQRDHKRISQIISTSYNKVLEYAYGIESSQEEMEERPAKMNRRLRTTDPWAKREKPTKIMEPLMPSAVLLVDSFLSTSSGTMPFQPLLRSYYDGLETPEESTAPNHLNLWTSQVDAMLCFTTTLLRVSAVLERPPSQLENQLFKVSSLIARLGAVNDKYKNSSILLFESLISTASANSSEPPSLLGHLGPQTAKNFLHFISDLDKPLSRIEHVRTIWDFLSKIVSSRQQWFANYLMTGKTPREALTSKTTGKDLTSLDKPLLTTALEALSGIKDLSQTEALPILEFVTLAQNFWPWTVCNSPKYSDFIKAISEHVGLFKPIQPSTSLEGVLDACYQTRIGAYIAEIMAMHLFHARQTGVPSPIRELLPNLSYFTRFAVRVPSYNNSLHALLKQNFEARYPGCTLADLKRTPLEKHLYGQDYFYDLHLADKMLSMTRAWTGRSDDGLRAELAHANVNLSLVDAQIALFHSWKYLSIELSGDICSDRELQTVLAKVVGDSLIANTRAQPPEDIFSRLTQTRADFAIVLTQRLMKAKSTAPEMQRLLAITWDAIRTLRGSFERAVPDGDILYYRSLLKLLFLTVRIHAEAKSQEEADNLRASKRITQTATIGPIVMDIIKHVVAIGIRELASVIHDSPAASSPEDLALITGILQSCLHIPGIELYHLQLVEILTEGGVPKVAVTLFSWSDSLAIDGDPIYGELSMLFLLELSSIPLMAEQLAIGGVLGHLSTANIISYLRRGGVSPFAESAGLQRCYSIWARGILPFLLNLIDSVQASIAVEVAVFLAQFRNLLAQSQQSLDAPETNLIDTKSVTNYITLTICSEVHSTALIIYILNGFRETLKGIMDIPELTWDSAVVLENVEFWLSSRALLRERLLPMGDREIEMKRKEVASGQGPVSKLEEEVYKELSGIRVVLTSGDNS